MIAGFPDLEELARGGKGGGKDHGHSGKDKHSKKSRKSDKHKSDKHKSY